MSRRKIIDMVFKRKAEILGSAGEADENQVLAQAAIIGGVKSTAWEDYMLQFVDADASGQPFQDQLMRLRGTDGSDLTHPDTIRNRAYLVANGMCGTFTREHFEDTVG